MCQVNVFQAKTDFSKLLAKLESAEEEEIVIARNGKPVARLVPWEDRAGAKRIGVAKGLFLLPDDIDEEDPDIAGLFLGGQV